jgi:hypothetical protein
MMTSSASDLKVLSAVLSLLFSPPPRFPLLHHISSPSANILLPVPCPSLPVPGSASDLCACHVVLLQLPGRGGEGEEQVG